MSAFVMEADDLLANSEDKPLDSIMDITMEGQGEESGNSEAVIASTDSIYSWNLKKDRHLEFKFGSSDLSQNRSCLVKTLFNDDNGDNLLAYKSPASTSYTQQSITPRLRRRSYESQCNDSAEKLNSINDCALLPINSMEFSSKFVLPQVTSTCKANLPTTNKQIQKTETKCSTLKRSNSTPALNNTGIRATNTSGTLRGKSRPISNNSRIRRYSGTVVGGNQSSTTGWLRSRLRLHQLQSEESLEGIQIKEAAHERDIHTTLQISSNCGDLSLHDRRSSCDSWEASIKPQFSKPGTAFTGTKASPFRTFDFNSLNPTLISQNPIHSHHPVPHMPSSSGIPSPLTFPTSPHHFSLSPLPPSPTRGMCGPRKQCFSPSLLNPASLTKGASRSTSPSPTRHHSFVSRRRSQSPCILRPSAFASAKRKYDSDSEGSCSPKRMFVQSTTAVVPHGSSGDANIPVTIISSNHAPVRYRTLAHRSHSLSSSSVDIGDMFPSSSPPHYVTTPFVTHQSNGHQLSGLMHPLHHSSTPFHGHNAQG